MNPYNHTPRSLIMALTPRESAGDRMSRMREAAAAKRTADLARRAEETEECMGYRIMPAIGTTGGAKNVGWEMHPPPGFGPVQYFYTRAQAIDAVSRRLHGRLQAPPPAAKANQ